MVELAGLLVLGFLAQWLAWRLKVPAILPLIVVGLLVGPISTYFTADGSKFIDGDRIFHGELLFDVIAISVGLILFEGGLTLKIKEVKLLGNMVRNLILAGTFITLIGGAIATHLLLDLGWRISFLFGSLIIVTGPTVIGPILRNVRANHNISTVLKWEGILIDPVGALVAILIYEFIVSGQTGEQFTVFALKAFFTTVLAGVFGGIAFAILSYYVLKKHLVPHYLRNIVMLAMVISCFALSEQIHHESGLLAVTILGMILANLRIENLRQILSFKEDVTLILISFLFVMLSSRMNIESLTIMLTTPVLWLFLVIIFVLRPITVFLSAIGSGLTMKERLFISYISPRGIVAAGVASIFAVRLSSPATEILPQVQQEAQLLLPLTFMVIVGTVVLQGLTAKMVAKLLKVQQLKASGIVFLGANSISRYLAKVARTYNQPVLLADTSRANIAEAHQLWLPTFEGSLLADESLEELELTQYGQVFATTSNTELNILSNRLLAKEVGKQNVFRLPSPRELSSKDLSLPKNLLFMGRADYPQLLNIFRNNPQISKMQVAEGEQLDDILAKLPQKSLPIFALRDGRQIVPITQQLVFEKEDEVLYVEL
jgi:NhaP-type Na+/H+ or K+/H+ antiporter